MFPIGRQIQENKSTYFFQGTNFPCLNGCPEVTELPLLSVEEYLKGQNTQIFEEAQDAYLELVQNMADYAFIFLEEFQGASLMLCVQGGGQKAPPARP